MAGSLTSTTTAIEDDYAESRAHLMANSYITIGAFLLDTELVNVDGTDVHRERNQVAGVGADDIAVVTDTDPVPGTDHGLVVKILDSINPVLDYKTSADLAASASVNLDGTTISAGTTGKLTKVLVSSSVPCRWEIIKRDGAAETTVGVVRTSGYGGKPDGVFELPDKHYCTLAYGDGDENFRITVTNKWILAADVDATIYWDEVS
jgi:hypothetical protein